MGEQLRRNDLPVVERDLAAPATSLAMGQECLLCLRRQHYSGKESKFDQQFVPGNRCLATDAQPRPKSPNYKRQRVDKRKPRAHTSEHRKPASPKDDGNEQRTCLV